MTSSSIFTSLSWDTQIIRETKTQCLKKNSFSFFFSQRFLFSIFSSMKFIILAIVDRIDVDIIHSQKLQKLTIQTNQFQIVYWLYVDLNNSLIIQQFFLIFDALKMTQMIQNLSFFFAWSREKTKKHAKNALLNIMFSNVHWVNNKYSNKFRLFNIKY